MACMVVGHTMYDDVTEKMVSVQVSYDIQVQTILYTWMSAHAYQYTTTTRSLGMAG